MKDQDKSVSGRKRNLPSLNVTALSILGLGLILTLVLLHQGHLERQVWELRRTILSSSAMKMRREEKEEEEQHGDLDLMPRYVGRGGRGAN